MNQTPLVQSNVNILPSLESFRYENIFNIYQNDNSNYFYNILAKTNFPTDIEQAYYDTFVVTNENMPYTLISYKIYGTILLWWLVCSVNNIQNPVFCPPAGTRLKYLTPAYVRSVVSQLQIVN